MQGCRESWDFQKILAVQGREKWDGINFQSGGPLISHTKSAGSKTGLDFGGGGISTLLGKK